MNSRLIFYFSLGFFFAAPETFAEDPAKVEKPAVKPIPRPDAKKSKSVEKKEGKDESKPEAKADKLKPAENSEVVTVEKGNLEITEEISGVLRSRKSTPLKMELQRWADLLVVEAVPHGAEVKKGDILVELDTRAIREKIEELEVGMPLKQLDLETSEMALEKLRKTTPITLEKARDAKMRAEEDFAYFEDVTRPMRERNAKEDVKQSKEYLAYAEEELNQLKKMYEADDLTEETEEIILRRAQNSVNDYRWRLEQTEERSRRSITTYIPREHKSLERSLLETQLNWRAQERSLPDALEKAELEFLAKVRSAEDLEKSLQEYVDDLEAMTVRSPHDGIVYYGMTQRGKWTTASTVERKLIPGGKLTMREIFMTVVDPEAQELLLTVPENKLADLSEGQPASIFLTSNPEVEISGEITSLSYVPHSDSTFSGVIELTKIAEEAILFPGMKAKAEITVYEKGDAVLIPTELVKEEDEESFVTLANGTKRRIETGRSSDGKVEVLKGLKPGDKIQKAGSAGDEEKEADESTDSKEKKE